MTRTSAYMYMYIYIFIYIYTYINNYIQVYMQNNFSHSIVVPGKFHNT